MLYEIYESLKARFGNGDAGPGFGQSVHDFAYTVGYQQAVKEMLVYIAELLDPSSSISPADVFQTEDRLSADEYGRSGPPAS